LNYNDWFQQGGYANILYWDVGGSIGGYMPFSAIQADGWEANGLTSDPKFVSITYSNFTGSGLSNNYSLASGSPCIGAGTNLSGLNLPGLTTNIFGVARPTSGAWNMGAY
jgi:hypothetical protein